MKFADYIISNIVRDYQRNNFSYDYMLEYYFTLKCKNTKVELFLPFDCDGYLGHINLSFDYYRIGKNKFNDYDTYKEYVENKDCCLEVMDNLTLNKFKVGKLFLNSKFCEDIAKLIERDIHLMKDEYYLYEKSIKGLYNIYKGWVDDEKKFNGMSSTEKYLEFIIESSINGSLSDDAISDELKKAFGETLEFIIAENSILVYKVN